MKDIFTSLQIACATMNEVFTEMLKAGFTEKQAINLLSSLIVKSKDVPG